MADHTEFKSENARNVILSYCQRVYFVDRVNVKVQEGVEKLKAIFHTKSVQDNTPQELNIEISQGIYDILVEYAKLDKLDPILVLHIEDGSSKWCLMSDDWLKNPTSNNNGSTVYVV